MPVDYSQLPNALNWQPLNQGINALAEGAYRNRQLDMEGQNQLLRQQQATREQQAFDDKRAHEALGQLAGLYQSVEAAPEADRPTLLQRIEPIYQRLRPRIKDFDADATAAGIDPNDHVGMGKLLTAMFQGPVDPLARQKTQAEIAQTQTQTALGRQKLETGKYVPVSPGTELFNTKTQQFVSGPEGGNIVGRIVDGIASGRQPPVFTGMGMGKLVGPVRAELERRGINVAEMQQEWNRAQLQARSVNGPQMTRYVGLTQSVDKTIDRVNELAGQMELSGIPVLNKAELIKLMQTQGNTPGGQLASQYLTAVNTLKEEFANLAQGGYAPTEPAWELANQQINANYGVKQLGASLGEIQRLMRYRLNAIPGINTVGPGAANRYIPGEEVPMGAPHMSTGEPTQAPPVNGPLPPGDYVFDPATGQLRPKQ